MVCGGAKRGSGDRKETARVMVNEAERESGERIRESDRGRERDARECWMKKAETERTIEKKGGGK